jgi:hypothetical protein
MNTNGATVTLNGWLRFRQKIGLRTNRPLQLAEFWFNSSGSFATLAAIRCASSGVSSIAELYHSRIVDLSGLSLKENCNERNYLFDFDFRFNVVGRLWDYASRTYGATSARNWRRYGR